jgi:hypothetical protein
MLYFPRTKQYFLVTEVAMLLSVEPQVISEALRTIESNGLMSFKIRCYSSKMVEKAQIKMISEFLKCRKLKLNMKTTREILEPIKIQYNQMIQEEKDNEWMKDLKYATYY